MFIKRWLSITVHYLIDIGHESRFTNMVTEHIMLVSAVFGYESILPYWPMAIPLLCHIISRL